MDDYELCHEAEAWLQRNRHRDDFHFMRLTAFLKMALGETTWEEFDIELEATIDAAHRDWPEG